MATIVFYVSILGALVCAASLVNLLFLGRKIKQIETKEKKKNLRGKFNLI